MEDTIVLTMDDVRLANRMVEGRRYLDVNRPERQDLAPIFRLANEVMKK